MHYIVFPIGDWSCDGHSCYANFLVKSDKNLSEIRDVHFKENTYIGSLCSEYNDNKIEIFGFYSFLIKYLPEEEAKQKIKELINDEAELIDEELEFKDMESNIKKTKHDYKVELSFEKNEENYQYLVIKDPKTMLNIWLLCLNIIEPTVNLECISEAMSQYFIKYKGYPYKPEGDITFYGIDKEKRHLDAPGYGVWQADDCDGEFYHDVN